MQFAGANIVFLFMFLLQIFLIIFKIFHVRLFLVFVVGQQLDLIIFQRKFAFVLMSAPAKDAHLRARAPRCVWLVTAGVLASPQYSCQYFSTDCRLISICRRYTVVLNTNLARASDSLITFLAVHCYIVQSIKFKLFSPFQVLIPREAQPPSPSPRYGQ